MNIFLLQYNVITPEIFFYRVSSNPQYVLLSSFQRSGRDPRGSDNLSAKSSDSDASEVSAVSRTSSASRFSSTSYMSVQSERPQGNRKIR